MGTGHERDPGMIRGLELLAPFLDLQGEGRGWRLSQSLMVNDLISHFSVMESPLKSLNDGVQELTD